MRRSPAACAAILTFLASCGGYRDFTLPRLTGPALDAAWHWEADPRPVLSPQAGWESSDVLNPSIIQFSGQWLNLYSGFDGRTWRTGLAVSSDGKQWTRRGVVLSPDGGSWEGGYIAANGSVAAAEGELRYYYQAGSPPRIGLATSRDASIWSKQGAPVVDTGPYGSWDERGVADPYVVKFGSEFFLFYTGMDRARRQRLGVAESSDGRRWYKLRTNPVLELGSYGDFDERGLGEPAVWASGGYYRMLYTGRDREEHRRLGMAFSRDGVDWRKHPPVIEGDQPWDSKVICDPTVVVDSQGVRVWFGGGDVPRPDERIHGQIGVGRLRAVYSTR